MITFTWVALVVDTDKNWIFKFHLGFPGVKGIRWGKMGHVLPKAKCYLVVSENNPFSADTYYFN